MREQSQEEVKDWTVKTRPPAVLLLTYWIQVSPVCHHLTCARRAHRSCALISGSFSASSCEGRTANSFWWSQRKWRRIRHGGRRAEDWRAHRPGRSQGGFGQEVESRTAAHVDARWPASRSLTFWVLFTRPLLDWGDEEQEALTTQHASHITSSVCAVLVVLYTLTVFQRSILCFGLFSQSQDFPLPVSFRDPSFHSWRSPFCLCVSDASCHHRSNLELHLGTAWTFAVQSLCWHNGFIWQQKQCKPRPGTPSSGYMSVTALFYCIVHLQTVTTHLHLLVMEEHLYHVVMKQPKLL